MEEFEIQSDSSNLGYAEERLFHFCNRYNVGTYFSVMSMGLRNAVENAIFHGNRGDGGKKVSVRFGTVKGGIFIEVEDEGDGFDYETYGELPLGEQEKGVGLFIMRKLSDRLFFSNHGSKVRMEFDIAGIDPSVSLQRACLLKERFALRVG